MTLPKLAFITASIALTLGCSEPRDPEKVLALQGTVERGEPQFQMTCARCHGEVGGGGPRAPALSAISRLSDRDIADAILNGRGAMRGTRLNEQQARDVLAFLRQRFPAPSPRPTPTDK